MNRDGPFMNWGGAFMGSNIRTSKTCSPVIIAVITACDYLSSSRLQQPYFFPSLMRAPLPDPCCS